MNIGIVGSGNVGGTLGKRWAQGGHSVVFSSRTPDSPEMKQLVAEAGPTARAATLADTVAATGVLCLRQLSRQFNVHTLIPWESASFAVKLPSVLRDDAR